MIDIPLASWVLFIGFLFLWMSYELYHLWKIPDGYEKF